MVETAGPWQTARMNLDAALAWASDRHSGVLITIRRDGRPQSSDIVYALRDEVARISVTRGRAKTRNLERDSRAVLHITAPKEWAYVSLDGTVELSPVAAVAGDAVCEELADLLRDVQGQEHPNWDEFYQAMIDDQRRVVRFTPKSATGQVR